MGGNGVTMGGR